MLDPNLAPVPLDNLLADRKTDPCSLVYLSGMKSLEKQKNSVEVFWCDPDTIILNREGRLLIIEMNRHDNVWSYPLFSIFDGIPN
ncbi:protein of unknown function [Magnetospirillum sp. XM-1]|nr:protein of unknown function [Magnetospirillum sp. XM-1]